MNTPHRSRYPVAFRTSISGVRPRARRFLAWSLALALAGTGIIAADRTFYVVNKQSIASFVIADDGTALPLEIIGATGRRPGGIVIAPDGRSAYVVDRDDGTVSAFGIDGNGRITPIGDPVETDPFAQGPFPTCDSVGNPCPIGLAMSPNGDWLYVTNVFSDTVSAFRVLPDRTVRLAGRPVPAGGTGPRGIVISPSGDTMYVSHRHADTIATFNVRGSDLKLVDITRVPGCEPVDGTPPQPECSPFWMSIAADGRWLYVINQASGDMQGFAVGLEGRITPVGSRVPLGGRAESIVITPDVRFLYVSTIDENDIKAYSILADGQLRLLGSFDTCDEAHIPAACAAVASALAPNARTLYVANTFKAVDDVIAFAIGDNGQLSRLGSVLTGGDNPVFQGMGMRPNQGPKAALAAVRPVLVNEPIVFNASESVDGDGEIVRYDWNFGDGTTVMDGGSQPVHVYSKPGRYVVTVTTTDDEGCSETLVFTGQTALCNVSPAAVASLGVQVRPRPTP